MAGTDKKRFSGIGSVASGTDKIIDEKIEKQKEIKKLWASRRPKTLAVSNKRPVIPRPSAIFKDDSKRRGISAYWFPMLCFFSVLGVAIWTFAPELKKSNSVPEPVVRVINTAKANEQKIEIKDKKDTVPVEKKVEKKNDLSAVKQVKSKESTKPSFDVVRVEQNGVVVIAGRGAADKNISVSLNNKIVATIAANKDGEFVYSPKNKLRPGNYVVQIISDGKKSDRVFLYIDERPDQSLSLLMTDKKSMVMQAPTKLRNGAFVVSKIDYLTNKRLVAQGKALPRTRVTMTLNNKLLGWTRVSDHKNFGLGAVVGDLKPGTKYILSLRMHDASGKTISEIKHSFVMPKMTGRNETFYIVRRDDSLWVIARNFLGSGFQFTVIAKENDIKNPDLIYPDQEFKIPVKSTK